MLADPQAYHRGAAFANLRLDMLSSKFAASANLAECHREDTWSLLRSCYDLVAERAFFSSCPATMIDSARSNFGDATSHLLSAIS
mmetsp:Transcript_8258/g.15023  ORF Transcript_8258/g.15023 Transcript_8258/m.15023 type:complete len:85 (-) Transcript_8258:20-274(-)